MADEEEPFVVEGKKKRERDEEDGEVVGGIFEHEIYGAADYVGQFLDGLWKFLEPGGHLNIDVGSAGAEKFLTLATTKRMGAQLPTTLRMTWKREGELLRIIFTGDKPSGYFKMIWKNTIEVNEITITREEAVVSLNSMIVPTQKFIFKTTVP